MPAEHGAHPKSEGVRFKGVRFELMCERDGEANLVRKNNRFELCSFRTRVSTSRDGFGFRAGEQVNPDFKMLSGPSIVDMPLHYKMFP